ncbi:MAG TPA: ATP-binding protein [Puia sp.]|nr:ATP-binding protein [Puia sp.]
MEAVIGRKEEKQILLEAVHSGHPELVAVYGRRRVGKTYLIRQTCANWLFFEFSGVSSGTKDEQLLHFTIGLQQAMKSTLPLAVPASWSQALGLLTSYADAQPKGKKLVIFFDEFPWICTQKSGFLSAFEFFWNGWASKHGHIKVIICGSAAAWMIQHVVNNKGGLHNRITRRIRLLPFNLHETEAYLQQKTLRFDRFQLLQLYMVMGGIPHYLKEIRKAESAAQAIDRICFSKDGLLKDEFNNLFQSLFGDDSRHMAVIKILSANGIGLTRKEIMKKTGLSSGGTITELLDELSQSGFITQWHPYNRVTKESIYKLSDEYSYFYLKFIAGNRWQGKGSWKKFSESPSWRSWSGVAFERACLKHIEQLSKELRIDGYNEVSAWRYHPPKGTGTQIDLVIDRKDFVINLCEMKFSEKLFLIDKAYAANLRNKQLVFKEQTATKKQLHLILVTSFGLTPNEYAKELVEKSILMDALFEP